MIIAPDSTALAGVGATGCASGSHTCSGSAPTLMPKPTSVRPITASRHGDAASAGPMSVKFRLPAACQASAMAANSASSPSTTSAR